MGVDISLEKRISLKENYSKHLLKKCIWAYFFLLILEGALRKWLLPGLASPLLIIRDPLAIAMIAIAWKNGYLPKHILLSTMILIGIVAFYTAIFFGHGNLGVALYGLRIILVHWPLIFIIGNIFDQQDVIQLGKAAIILTIPMTILMALQYFSPQSAWVNRGIGGDMEGSGFNAGAGGYFRPSGTFSFTAGLVHFYNLVACFLLYFWLKLKSVNWFILILATLCLIAAIPLSISRGLFFGILVSFFFFIIALLSNPTHLYKFFPIGIGLLLVLMILSNTSYFQTSIETFLMRFEMANKVEGGMKGVIGGRYLGGMIKAILDSEKLPFFGHGMGMGTNVGSVLLTGEASFLIEEGEWGRIIGEMGALLGITVILLRLGICAKIAFACYSKMINQDFLPWLLLSFCLLIVPEGQWARPTSLGFSTLIAGLTIASLHTKVKTGNEN